MSSIAPSLQSFDDVTEMKWVVHPLGSPSAIIGIDSESTVAFGKSVAGRAGRWARWLTTRLPIGARNDLGTVGSPEMMFTFEVAGDSDASSMHDSVMKTTQRDEILNIVVTAH